jgi:hypothetical protein
MENKSIFQGIKELGQLRLMDNGCTWGVYERANDAYVFRMNIIKIDGESNTNLYNRAIEALYDDDE